MGCIAVCACLQVCCCLSGDAFKAASLLIKHSASTTVLILLIPASHFMRTGGTVDAPASALSLGNASDQNELECE